MITSLRPLHVLTEHLRNVDPVGGGDEDPDPLFSVRLFENIPPMARAAHPALDHLPRDLFGGIPVVGSLASCDANAAIEISPVDVLREALRKETAVELLAQIPGNPSPVRGSLPIGIGVIEKLPPCHVHAVGSGNL